MNRRVFLVTAAAGAARIAGAQAASVPDVIRKLRPMTEGIQPITDDERRARISRARTLMRENKLDAVFLAGGSSMFYFTGTRSPSIGLILPERGEPAWIVPSEDEAAAHQSVRFGKEILSWTHAEGP